MLAEKVKALQSSVAADGVTRALSDVRQLAGRPAPLIDSTALMAALEHLADSARDSSHKDRAKYEAIFKQCRPLANNPRLPAVGRRAETGRLPDTEDSSCTHPSGHPVLASNRELWAVGVRFLPSAAWSGIRGSWAWSRRRIQGCRQFGHFAAQGSGRRY